MTDVFLSIVPLLLGVFIGPQIVVTLLYGFPRGVQLASRGVVRWSFPFSFLAIPAIWIAVLYVLALFFPSFGLKVAGSSSAVGAAPLIWSRDSVRADFADRLQRAAGKAAARN